MEQSLSKIATTLPADTQVYPGHGPQTTIADELKYNPYLKR
jgi:glyoxylase-like metal-dependent hydrolase (beta-lactamase superfamily II)